MTHHASWVSTFAHLKTEEHHIAVDKRKTQSLFLYYGSILFHQEVWLLLLDVLMKATMAIKLYGPGHSFSLSARISFGLHGDGEEQTICGAHNGIISATFRRITTWFIGQHSALRSFLVCMALPVHTDIRAVSVCCCVSLRLLKLSYYHIYLGIPTWMSDLTWLLSELYCAAYLSHYILISE